jgi:hypothetical protein
MQNLVSVYFYVPIQFCYIQAQRNHKVISVSFVEIVS